MSLPPAMPPVPARPLLWAGWWHRFGSVPRLRWRPAIAAHEQRDLTALFASFAVHALAILALTSIVVGVGPRRGAAPILIATAIDDASGLADLDGMMIGLEAQLPQDASGGPAGDGGGVPAVTVEAPTFEDASPLGPRREMLDAAGLLGKVGAGRGAAAGAGHDDVEVKFYGLKARGRKFVFVADCSGSMHGPALARLKRELGATIRKLPPEAEFFIVFFNHTAVPMVAQGLVPATPQSKRRHLAWVSRIKHGGGTDPTAALGIALRMEPSTVFLMTDGVFWPEPVLAMITRLNEGGSIQIHTIAVGLQAEQPVLQRIAEENDGQFQAVGR